MAVMEALLDPRRNQEGRNQEGRNQEGRGA
jgi:aspartate carbamoyltransferase catalytic subunit